jgi:hypothetical protein
LLRFLCNFPGFLGVMTDELVAELLVAIEEMEFKAKEGMERLKSMEPRPILAFGHYEKFVQGVGWGASEEAMGKNGLSKRVFIFSSIMVVSLLFLGAKHPGRESGPFHWRHMEKFFLFLGLQRAPTTIMEAQRVICELFSAERKYFGIYW